MKGFGSRKKIQKGHLPAAIPAPAKSRLTRSLPRQPAAVAFLITAALVTGLLVAPGRAQEPTSQPALHKAVAVIHCDSPPASFKSNDDYPPSGFFVDIMDIIGKRAGLEVTYVCDSGWPELIETIESGKADLGALMKNAEREQRLLFTAPIEMTNLSFFSRSQSRSGNDATPEGQVVGVIKGSLSFKELKSRPGIQLHQVDSYEEGILGLLSGVTDLFAGEEGLILRQARETGLEERIKRFGEPFLQGERGIAVRKDNPALLARLNAVLHDFVGTPEYQEIYLKWYGRPPSYWTARRMMTGGALILLAAVCGMAVWRFRSVSNLNRELVLSIAERRRAEQIVQASEARLRLITDNMVDMVGQFDERANFLYASPSYERILGYRPEELVGRRAVDMIHPDDRDGAVRAIDEMLRAGTGSAQFRYLHKDGGYRWIESTGRNIVSEDGRILGSILGSRDISERRRAEEALLASEAMKRKVLDSVDDEFIVVDQDYRIVSANRAYCAHFNIPSDQIVGKHCYEVSHHTAHPCHETGEDCAVRRAFETGEPCVANHVHHDADGQVQYVETRAFPLRNETGTITSVIESVTNITEKRLLEQERLKTQKLEAIGMLAGGIAHDFNNLLQGVFGYLSLARLRCDNKEQGLAALGEAEKALHLSVKLTNQLLTFSKGGKPVKRSMRVRPVVESAARFALSGSRSGYLIAGEDLWPVEADEGQIGQVIQNIVLNGDQAMPDGGQIVITTRNVVAPGRDLPPSLAPGRYVEIAVADTGIGIPQHHAPKIFDPYFTTKEKGTGLGLATSYSIVRNHHGTITMESEVGKGTTFWVYLPAATKSRSEPPAKVAAGPPATRKGSVLLMDDDEMILTVGGELIKALGHDVEFALHGEEALRKYQQANHHGQPFDVVILDLTIRGGMGGAETLQRMLQIDRGVKGIVTSGYSDDAITANFAAHGFKAFLKKPYNYHHLQSTLNALI